MSFLYCSLSHWPPLDFHMLLGNQTQAFILKQQALYPRNHLPSLQVGLLDQAGLDVRTFCHLPDLGITALEGEWG